MDAFRTWYLNSLKPSSPRAFTNRITVGWLTPAALAMAAMDIVSAGPSYPR